MVDRNPASGAADPLIDEVRAVRRALCEEFDGNLDRLCDFLLEIESRNAERVVRPAKPAEGSDRRVRN